MLSQPIIHSLLPLMGVLVVVLVIKRSVNSFQCGAFVSFMNDYSLCFVRIIRLCVLQSRVVQWHPRGFQHLCFNKKKKKEPHTCIHKCTPSSIIIWVYGEILLCILEIKPRKQNVNHSIGTNFVPLLIQQFLNLLLLFDWYQTYIGPKSNMI